MEVVLKSCTGVLLRARPSHPFWLYQQNGLQYLGSMHRYHGRRKVHVYFLLLLCKSSIWFTDKHIFKIIIYFFDTSKSAANYVISFEVYDGYIGQKILKLWRQESWPSGPWLSCPYNENTLMDLPFSVIASTYLWSSSLLTLIENQGHAQ
jgi:hypothetical protein